MKLKRSVILLFAILLMLFSACEGKEEFVLESNLRSVITELALNYDDFGVSETKEENYPIIFISKFCQNSRLTFDYLERLKKDNNGILSREQIEYMQYSLTNEFVDFQKYVNEDGVDAYQASSGLGFGEIVSYNAQENGDEVNLAAQFEFRGSNLESESAEKIYELDVVLVRNDESCFDGYSIKSLSKKNVTPVVTGDGKEHAFFGLDMGIEDNGIFIFECYGSNDEVTYGTHVEVDLSSNAELATLVRENAGEEFVITYIWENTMSEPIERVIPTNLNIVMDDESWQELIEKGDIKAGFQE